MKKGIIRPIVICLFRNQDKILVIEGLDEYRKDYYYRPVGGGIEYGESSEEALKREMKEELNADISDIKFITTIENIFTYNGELGHEVVFVYDAKFTDLSIYEKEELSIVEDNGVPYKAKWVTIEDCSNGNIRLVPEQLIKIISR